MARADRRIVLRDARLERPSSAIADERAQPRRNLLQKSRFRPGNPVPRRQCRRRFETERSVVSTQIGEQLERHDRVRALARSRTVRPPRRWSPFRGSRRLSRRHAPRSAAARSSSWSTFVHTSGLCAAAASGCSRSPNCVGRSTRCRERVLSWSCHDGVGVAARPHGLFHGATRCLLNLPANRWFSPGQASRRSTGQRTSWPAPPPSRRPLRPVEERW